MLAANGLVLGSTTLMLGSNVRLLASNGIMLGSPRLMLGSAVRMLAATGLMLAPDTLMLVANGSMLGSPTLMLVTKSLMLAHLYLILLKISCSYLSYSGSCFVLLKLVHICFNKYDTFTLK